MNSDTSDRVRLAVLQFYTSTAGEGPQPRYFFHSIYSNCDKCSGKLEMDNGQFPRRKNFVYETRLERGAEG